MSATEDEVTTLKKEGELEEDEESSEEGSEDDDDESDDEEGIDDGEEVAGEDEESESEEEDGEEEEEEDGEEDGETGDEDEDEEEDADDADREGDQDVDDSSGDENCDRCPICLNRLRNQDIGTPESCDHCFCLECIQEWARVTNTCPVDRQVFRIVLARHAGEEKIYKQFPVDDNKQDNEEVEDDPTFCEVCGQSDREDRLLLCDGCDLGYHCDCLDPPLASVPVQEWFCPDCQDRRNAATIEENQHLGRQIARTRISERVRRIIADARAERAERRIRIAQMIDENESFMEQEPTPRPSTSGSTSGTRKKRKTTRKRKTKRKTTRKRKTTKRKTKKGKTRRKRKTTGKRKRKTKRKTKRKSTSASPGLARTVRVSSTSVKARIADKLGLSKPPVGRSIPLQKLPTNARQEGGAGRVSTEYGAASFSILGSKDELYLFADQEGEERQIVNRPAIPAERLLSSSAKSSHLPLSFSSTKRKVVKEPPAASVVSLSAASANFDLLGSIMQNQDLLHKGSRHVTINRDGTLSAAKSENSTHLKKSLSTSDQPAVQTSQSLSPDGGATRSTAAVSWSSGSPRVSSSPGCVSSLKAKSPETSLSKLHPGSSKTSTSVSSQLAELEAQFREVTDSDEELIAAESGLVDDKPKITTMFGYGINGSRSELRLSSEINHEVSDVQSLVNDEVDFQIKQEDVTCDEMSTRGLVKGSSVFSERQSVQEEEDFRGNSKLEHTNSGLGVRSGDSTHVGDVEELNGHFFKLGYPVSKEVQRTLDKDTGNERSDLTENSNSLPAMYNCDEVTQESNHVPVLRENYDSMHNFSAQNGCVGGEEKFVKSEADWSVDKEEGEASDTDDEGRQEEEDEGDGEKEDGEIVDEGEDGEKLNMEDSGQWQGENVTDDRQVDLSRKRYLPQLDETDLEGNKKIKLEDMRSTVTESMADPVSDDDSDDEDVNPDNPVNASFMMANFLHSLKTNEFDRKREKALRKERRTAEEAKSKEELEREKLEKDKASHVISILDFIGNESARKFGLPSVSVKESKPREYRGPVHRNNGGGDGGDRFNYWDRKQNNWSSRWKATEEGDAAMNDSVSTNRPFDKRRLSGQQDYKQRPRSGSQDSRPFSQRSGSHDSRLSKSRHRRDSARDRSGKEKRSPRRKDKRRKSRDDEDNRKNKERKHKRTKWSRKEELREEDSSNEEGSEKNLEVDDDLSSEKSESVTNGQPQTLSSEGPPLIPGHYAPQSAPHPSFYPPPPAGYPNPRAPIPQTHPVNYGQPPYVQRPSEAPRHPHPPRPAYGQPVFPPNYGQSRYPHPTHGQPPHTIPHQTHPGAVPQQYVSSYYRHPHPTAAATLPTTVGSVSRPPLSHVPPLPHTTSLKPSHTSQHHPHGLQPPPQPLGAHGSHPQAPPQRHPVYAAATRHPVPHIPVTTHPHAGYTTHPAVAANQYASHLSSHSAYMQRHPTSHLGAAAHSSAVLTAYSSSHPPASHPSNHPGSHPSNHPGSHPSNHPASHPSYPGTAGMAAQRNAYPTAVKQETATRIPTTTHVSHQRSETSTQHWSESASNSRSDSHRKKDYLSLSPKEERKPSSYCISPPRSTIKGVTTYDKVDSSILLNEVKKGFRQLVEDAVRCALKPAWSSKKITKDEYKDIFKRAVEKVCGSKETVVHQEKIQSLVSAYVIKARKARTS